MSYENKDKYLLLKQNLVFIELARLKASVSIKGESHDIRSIEGAIVNGLNDIETNFTTPTEMLENSPIYLDLCSEHHFVRGMLEPINSTDPRFKHIPQSPDDMHRVIFELPNFQNYIDKHAENLKNQSFFDQSRTNAGRLIEATGLAIRVIRRWGEGRDHELKLGQILLLVNMVETVEWLFDFTNATSRRQILNVDNNPESGC